MSGRRRTTFAVDREPVLAWNVPTFHGGAPYADMPAAAAVSPVVPPGADPYGRCWQNHVEAGCLPYISTLYSNSLPPSYRVQPCVSSLGQIWPPTPPPDGCSRHDAASNSFYFCPPVSPMFVHGDGISQTISSALPRVGHYSQLTEPNIESTVHSSGYQLESPKSSAPHLSTACRTAPKCKSSNSAHLYDSTKKKPDIMLMSQGVTNTEKSVVNVHHSLCPCGSCSGKYLSDLTRGSDKENIHNSALHNAFHSDLKQASDKVKQKMCDAGKGENWNFLQFRGTGQEIPFEKCSCSIQGQCVIQPNYYKENKVSFASVKMPAKDTYKKPLNFPMSNADMMYSYSCSESRRPNSSVCTSSSPYPVMTAPPTLSSSPSTSTSVRNVYSAETYPVASVVSTPVRDVYSIPLHLQMNPETPSYNKSCCFSPSYQRGKTLYHNVSSEAEQSNQKQNSLVICGNSVNASPLKNVYFSHLESENLNFDVHKNHHGSEHPSNLTADTASIAYATINANSSSDFCSPYSVATTDYNKNQQSKMVPSLTSTPKLPQRKREDIEFIGEKKKVQRNRIKREKETVDCEFQTVKCMNFDYCPEMANTPSTPDALNLSAIGTWHKTEDPGSNSTVAQKDSQNLYTSTPPEFDTTGPQSKDQNRLQEEVSSTDVKTSKSGLFQHLKSGVVCNETTCTASTFGDMLCGEMLQMFGESSSGPQTVSASDKKQASVNMCEKMDSKTFKDSVETMLLPEDLDVKRDIVIPAVDTVEKCGSPSDKFQSLEFESSNNMEQDDSKCSQKEDSVGQQPVETIVERPNSMCKIQSDLCDATKVDTSENLPLSPIPTPIANEPSEVPPVDSSVEISMVESSRGKDQNFTSPYEEGKEFSSIVSVDSTQDADFYHEDVKTKQNQSLENSVLLSAGVSLDSAESSNDHLVPADGTTSSAEITRNEPIPDETNIKFEEAHVQCESNNAEEQEQDESKADLYDSMQWNVGFDDFHGLHVLLDGIAYQEKDSGMSDAASDSDLTANSSVHDEESINKELEASPVPVNVANMDNLSLLCACAEHLTLKGSISMKTDETVQSHKIPDINSNYPSKFETENLKSSTKGEHGFRNAEAEVMDSVELNELEMRKKLAELQKKYKAKQKELARLKSKKVSKKSMKKTNLDTSKGSSIPHSSRSEPQGASCNLRDDSSAVDSSVSLDKLHSTFQKCDMKKFEDFVSNELSSMVMQCSQAASSNSLAPTYSASKFSSNSLLTKRTYSVADLKETSQSEDGDQTNIALLKDKMQAVSPGKHSNVKSAADDLQNGQREKSKRNVVCPSVKTFPIQPMSLRSRAKRKTLSSLTVKKKIQKTSETDISQSSSESVEECSPKKLRSSENEKEVPLNSSECITGATNRKSFSSKRKTDSPRKYSPLKQGNLTETIVTKQLRSRILISEELSELSEANDEQDDSDYVTEELFDALRKCHLSESPQRTNIANKISKSNRNVFAEEKHCGLLPKHLVDKQRVLATEDGLFYAGHIKPIQPPDVYGIVLDGERGTKPHIFSREEILSDVILEVKPQSVLELPLGTRVCAYWSQQYRCLYPGRVAKLTSKPKLTSSECVFVEFDDGDSGQIPIKDVRLLPLNMLKDMNEDTAVDNSSVKSEKSTDPNKRIHNGKIKMQKKRTRSNKKELRAAMKKEPVSEEKVVSSQCDLSNDLNMSSSQTTDTKQTGENLDIRLCHSDSPGKHPKRHCKSKSNSKDKTKDSSPLEKSKKHKKYREHHKHRHHHRHRHHHHRHCHRHHHCKKHKHKKSITVNTVTPSQDHLNTSIPSSSIPDCSSASKTFQDSQQQVEECNECDVHSTSKELPQDSQHTAALQSSGGKMASKKQVLKTRKSLHPFLTRSRKSTQRSGLPFCTR